MIDKVFEKIRTENYRMAIVKEKKEVVGIITLQDILVSLVGKMSDEKEKLLPKELVDIK
jgi:CBS domain containing-hemolysin-like protein